VQMYLPTTPSSVRCPLFIKTLQSILGACFLTKAVLQVLTGVLDVHGNRHHARQKGWL
jgi:hypothetical protein